MRAFGSENAAASAWLTTIFICPPEETRARAHNTYFSNN